MDPIERHRQMVERYPENELGRFSLGKALFDLGRFDEAEPHLQVALKKKPDWMVVQILIGKCALEQGRRSEAIAAFERGLAKGNARNPEEAKLNLGISQIKAGKKEAAAATLASVQGDETLKRLARLWSQRAR